MRHGIRGNARTAALLAFGIAATLPVCAAPMSTVALEHAEHTQAQRSQTHTPGYLGIVFHDLTEDQAAAMHLKSRRGIEVILVDHDGPAGKSGLQPHDIIVSYNGQPAAGSELLRKMIHDQGAGANITLGILRSGQPQTVSVQLAERADVEREARLKMAAQDPPPSDDDPIVTGFVESYTQPAPPAPPGHAPSFLESMLHTTPFTGLAMEIMEPQLASFFGAPAGSGLLVQTVMPNSPAAASGLRAGDVVLQADGNNLRTTSDWMRRLHASKGQPITLVVLREKRELTMVLTPEFHKHSELQWPRFFGVEG